jgi:hypothetical protein
MMPYIKDERGRRVFCVGDRSFRAYWMSLGHYWSVYEIGQDGQRIGKGWQRKNWADVESFVEWLVRLDADTRQGVQP